MQQGERALLSAAAVDTSFGVGGYVLGYQPIAARDDGYIIASPPANGASPVLLAPNGGFISSYSGPVPQPPAENKQSDGRLLKLSGAKMGCYSSGDQLTRYNT